MKTTLYVKIFLLIIFVFFGYYVYNVVQNFTNSDYDIKSKNNILFYDYIATSYSNINSIIDHKLSILRTYDDFDNRTLKLYQCDNSKSIIELNNIYTGVGQNDFLDVISFAKYIKDLGIDFIYMEPPVKSYFYQDILNKYNYNVDTFNYYSILNTLKNNNIDYLDTYDMLSNSKINRDNLYYNSDHHPKIETSYYMTKQLIKKINQDFKYNLDSNLITKENLIKKNLPNSEKGYYDRILRLNSKFYDDFIYFIPKYNTSYEICNHKCVTGNIEQTVYNIGVSNNEQDPYLQIPGGTQKLVKYINNNAPNGKKIVIIANSFVKGMLPFLSLTFKEIDIIDVRTGTGIFKYNLRKYIKDNNPDLVIYYTMLYGEEYNKLA